MRNIVGTFATVFGFAAILTASSAVVEAQSNRHTLVLENNSGYDIYEVHLTPTSDPVWGEDQLGDGSLQVGEQLELFGLAGDDYDLKIVDQDGDVCTRRIGIHGDRTWNITPERLLGCEFRQHN